MMRTWPNSLVLISALALCAGCKKSASPPSVETSKSVQTPASASSPLPGSPPEKPNAPPVASKNETADKAKSSPAVPLSSLPATLKNEAYAYYGLGIGAPQKLTLRTDKTGTSTMVRTVKLLDVKDGKATFEEEQTGGPEGDQRQTMSLEPDGIYVTAVSPGTLKTTHVIALPVKLHPGDTWSDHTVLDTSDGSLTLDNNWKVLGTRSVKVAAGQFDALLVSGVGHGKVGSEPLSVKTEFWYVKGIGAVKQAAEFVRGSYHINTNTELDK